MLAKTAARLMIAFTVMSIAAILAAVVYRTWPREIADMRSSPLPFVSLRNGCWSVQYRDAVMLAEVGVFQDELLAYLHFDYLRSRSAVSEPDVLLTVKESRKGPIYHLQMVAENNLLSAVPYLAKLKAQGYIPYIHPYTTTMSQLAYRKAQTRLFVAAYNVPVRKRLEALNSTQLVSPVARFLLFKSRTDPRVRESADPTLRSLSGEQAEQLAADIVSVASFYQLPLDFFLGIGAMENNYLSVNGDLEHAVWKRRAAVGDIILKRKCGRVLVRNYSIGMWQITRETLRYAHRLYLVDTRDYNGLPERLRPPPMLDIDSTDPHVLTTYAGLLFNDLLNHFNGDIRMAVGAYNGGVRKPNLRYSAGAGLVAAYARKVVEQAADQSGQSVVATRLPSQDRRIRNVAMN
jgi:hypothetical protein